MKRLLRNRAGRALCQSAVSKITHPVNYPAVSGRQQRVAISRLAAEGLEFIYLGSARWGPGLLPLPLILLGPMAF